MVDFSVGFDTTKADEVCKQIVENIPGTVLELIEGTRSGEEHAVAVSVVKGQWKTTDVRTGSETDITGEIISDLWQEALEQSGTDYNANTSEIYMIHTHPSGLAGMSFHDVTASISMADNAAPVTGDFVITEHRGRVKINGVTLKDSDRDSIQLIELKDRAGDMEQTVESGEISNNMAKQRLTAQMKKLFNTCSYMASVADIENRARHG